MYSYKRTINTVLILAAVLLIIPQLSFAQDENRNQNQNQNKNQNKYQNKSSDFEVPFVDENGDGINDLMQSRWGLRFVKKQHQRNAIWDQLNVEIVFQEDGRWVDTDGDGVGDIQMKDYILGLLDTDGDGTPDMTLREYLGLGSNGGNNGQGGSVDTDGNGTFETPMYSFIEEQLNIDIVGEKGDKMVDTDGDGVGDIAFRDYVLDLLDTDGDGTPDMTMAEYLGLSDDEIQNRMQRFQAFRDEVRARREQGMSPYVDEDGDGNPDNLPEGFKWRRGKTNQ